jgi:DNA-binding transcriptional ArsR family regulator
MNNARKATLLQRRLTEFGAMIDLDSTLTALADPTRRGIVELLSRRPHRAGELADVFEMSAPAISRHLRVLRTRGLVEEQRAEGDARWRVFRLRREPFSELSTWLGNVQTFWNEQLDSFHEHVANKRKGKSV